MDIKDIEKFLKLCRKQGVNEIKFEGLHVKFGELPQKSSSEFDVEAVQTPDDLSPEQLMFYAVNNGAQQ